MHQHTIFLIFLCLSGPFVGCHWCRTAHSIHCTVYLRCRYGRSRTHWTYRLWLSDTPNCCMMSTLQFLHLLIFLFVRLDLFEFHILRLNFYCGIRLIRCRIVIDNSFCRVHFVRTIHCTRFRMIDSDICPILHRYDVHHNLCVFHNFLMNIDFDFHFLRHAFALPFEASISCNRISHASAFFRWTITTDACKPTGKWLTNQMFMPATIRWIIILHIQQ